MGPNQTEDLFGEEYAQHADEIAKRITNEIGMLDMDKLFEQFPRLMCVDEIANQRHFHHWELVFADVFYGKRNDDGPRWRIRSGVGQSALDQGAMWKEAGVLGDNRPIVGTLRKHSAVESRERERDEAFGSAWRVYVMLGSPT